MSDLKIVNTEFIDNPTTRFIMAWSGKKGFKGIPVYTFSDGKQVQLYPASPLVADYTYIGRNCSDVTGENLEPYTDLIRETWSARDQQRTANNIYLNSREMDTPDSESEVLARIKVYEGGLRYDPEDWPEPFKSAWFESH